MGRKQVADSSLGDDRHCDRYSDRQLVLRIQERGSPRHFELLVARYQERVYRLVCGVLGPTYVDDAVDVAQSAWLKVHTQLSHFRAEASFATWLYRLVYHCAIDQLRRHRRQRERDAVGVAPADHHTPAQSAESASQAAAVRLAVDNLPETYRLVILLYYWQEYSVNDIAEILSASGGTIKSYLYRARQRLARILEHQHV